MTTSFDVFLSHNSSDKPTVIRLAEALKDRGLRPWLDVWDLQPGLPWQKALEEIIETVPAAAVLVGGDGLGPWEESEMRACLSEYVKRELPVIPVLLPGTPRKPKLPPFPRAAHLGRPARRHRRRRAGQAAGEPGSAGSRRRRRT